MHNIYCVKPIKEERRTNQTCSGKCNRGWKYVWKDTRILENDVSLVEFNETGSTTYLNRYISEDASMKQVHLRRTERN